MHKSALPPAEATELCWTPSGLAHRQARVREITFLGALVCSVLGGWLLLFGLFFWPTNLPLPALGVVLAGTLLVISGLGACFWGWRRGRRVIISVRVDPTGIQAGLRDGSVLPAAWADPNFSLDLWIATRGGPDPATLYGLAWKMKPVVGGAYLTSEGFSELVETAKRMGVAVTTKSYGTAPNLRTTFMMRGPAAEP